LYHPSKVVTVLQSESKTEHLFRGYRIPGRNPSVSQHKKADNIQETFLWRHFLSPSGVEKAINFSGSKSRA